MTKDQISQWLRDFADELVSDDKINTEQLDELYEIARQVQEEVA